MKRFILVVLCTLIVPMALICDAGLNEPPLSSAFAAGSETTGSFGVDQLMNNVDKYGGPISVEGVVSAVSPGDQMLSLIDTQEFKRCAVVTCAKLTLPVRWTVCFGDQ